MAKTKESNKTTTLIKEAPTNASNSGLGAFLWLFIAVIGLAIVYGVNKDFFENKIWLYYDEYKEQKEELSDETRWKKRFGDEYLNSKAIAAEFLKKAKPNEVLLIPVTTMFTANKIHFGKVPEPSVFYYYTGVKTVKQNCKTNCAAQWYVVVQNGGFVIEKINSKNQQDSIVSSWSQYPADAY
jgi:hypothetical protein